MFDPNDRLRLLEYDAKLSFVTDREKDYFNLIIAILQNENHHCITNDEMRVFDRIKQKMDKQNNRGKDDCR